MDLNLESNEVRKSNADRTGKKKIDSRALQLYLLQQPIRTGSLSQLKLRDYSLLSSHQLWHGV